MHATHAEHKDSRDSPLPFIHLHLSHQLPLGRCPVHAQSIPGSMLLAVMLPPWSVISPGDLGLEESSDSHSGDSEDDTGSECGDCTDREDEEAASEEEDPEDESGKLAGI